MITDLVTKRLVRKLIKNKYGGKALKCDQLKIFELFCLFFLNEKNAPHLDSSHNLD